MNIEQKQRLFYLVEKYLDSNQPLIKKLINKHLLINIKAKQLSKITQKELRELIELITNHNPYTETLDELSVKYEISISKKDNLIASYSTNIDQISFYSNFIKKMLYGKFLFSDLVDTISHEKRHHAQDLFVRKLATQIQFKNKIIEHYKKNELLTKKQYSYIVNYLNGEELLFATNSILNKHSLVKRKYLPEFNGAYLSLEHERDAFKTGYKNTRNFIYKLINDPFCPAELKTKLEEDYKRYRKNVFTSHKNQRKYIKRFEELKTKLTNKVLFIINSDTKNLYPFEIENTTRIMNLCTDLVIENFNLENKIKCFKFVIDHHISPGKYLSVKSLYIKMLNSLTTAEKTEYKKQVISIISNIPYSHEMSKTLFKEILLSSDENDKENLTEYLCTKIDKTSLENIINILTCTISFDNLNLDKIALKIENKFKKFLELYQVTKQQLTLLKTIANLLLAQTSKATMENDSIITNLLEKLNNVTPSKFSILSPSECALKN